jgi:hypothetical protein
VDGVLLTPSAQKIPAQQYSKYTVILCKFMQKFWVRYFNHPPNLLTQKHLCDRYTTPEFQALKDRLQMLYDREDAEIKLMTKLQSEVS